MSNCFVTKKLNESADLYQERNEVYGDAYKRVGYVMNDLFPRGVILNSPSDFNRFGCLHTMASKMCRYANAFDKGGHQDSMDDISVYAAMIQELDNVPTS